MQYLSTKKDEMVYPAERVFKFLEYKGITKYEFHKKIGVSRSFLDKAKEIRTDNVKKIIENYPDINPKWLITGEGSMLIDNKDKSSLLDDLGIDLDLRAVGTRIRELINDADWEKDAAISQIVEAYQEFVDKKKLDLRMLNYWAQKGYSVNWILTGKGAKKMMDQREMYTEYTELKEHLDEIKEFVNKEVEKRWFFNKIFNWISLPDKTK